MAFAATPAESSNDFAAGLPGMKQGLWRAANGCAVLLLLIGVAVLAGWAFQIDALKTILPHRVSMKANTALGFFACGISLFATLRPSAGFQRVSRLVAVFILALGAATLAEFLFGINLGIDDLLFRDSVQLINPGRPAFITAGAFMLSGLALLLLNGRRLDRKLSQIPTLLLAGIAVASIIGYLYGVAVLYGSLQNVNTMALHTGVGFLVLSCGLILAHSESTIVRVLCAAETGGWLTRRFLAAVIVLPVLLGYLYLHPAVNFGQLRFGMALFAVTLVGGGTMTLILLANFLNNSQQQARRAEAALLQSEKLAAVGRLSASIAHEINNPIDAVMNLLYLLRDHAPDPDAQTLLDLADSELKRVANITSQTLNFHKQASRPVPVLSCELFRSVLTLHEGRIRNAGVQVERRERADLPMECFEGEIRQVLSNLVANAIDATLPGGRLLLRSRNATEYGTGRRGVRMTIADTGSGMDAKTLARVFEAFFTTKGFEGTGLGLWITSEILGRHGTHIQIRSSRRESAHGSVFVIFLPWRYSDPHQPASPDAPSRKPSLLAPAPGRSGPSL